MGISSNSPGHLTFVHLISLTFNKKKERFFLLQWGQTNEFFAITKPQPELEQAFIWCNRWIFCIKPLRKIN